MLIIQKKGIIFCKKKWHSNECAGSSPAAQTSFADDSLMWCQLKLTQNLEKKTK